VEVAHGHTGDAQAHAEARGHERAVPPDGGKHTATHGPAADQTQVHLLH
jgi:hypothetical protein